MNSVAIVARVVGTVITVGLFPLGILATSSTDLIYATGSLQGNIRPTMEDEFDNKITATHSFFAVYDGHGGGSASWYAQQNLYSNLCTNTLFSTDLPSALKQAFVETSQNYTGPAGTTAVAAFFDKGRMTIAHVGDSRAVLCKNGIALQLSEDHNSENKVEFERVIKAGGTFPHSHMMSGYRPTLQAYSLDAYNNPIKDIKKIPFQFTYVTSPYALGGLAVTRALGDHRFNNTFKVFGLSLPLGSYIISPEPEVTIFTLDGTEEFLVLACDGLFDVMTNDAVTQFIKAHMKKHDVLPKTITQVIAQTIVDALAQEAIAIYDHDNVTVTILFFQ